MLQAKNKKLKLDDIRVPRRFAESRPSPEKLNEKYRRYIETGVLDKVYVDEDMNLVDGYISFLIARMLGANGVRRGAVLIDRDKRNQKSEPEKKIEPKQKNDFTVEEYEKLLRRFENLEDDKDPFAVCDREEPCSLCVFNQPTCDCDAFMRYSPRAAYAKLVAYFAGDRG